MWILVSIYLYYSLVFYSANLGNVFSLIGTEYTYMVEGFFQFIYWILLNTFVCYLKDCCINHIHSVLSEWGLGLSSSLFSSVKRILVLLFLKSKMVTEWCFQCIQTVTHIFIFIFIYFKQVLASWNYYSDHCGLETSAKAASLRLDLLQVHT